MNEPKIDDLKIIAFNSYDDFSKYSAKKILDLYEELDSQKAIAEKQKVEIERVGQSAKHWQDRYDGTADKLDSQLAITELAVKKFEQVLQHSPMGSASFNVAVSALAEIERLQNG